MDDPIQDITPETPADPGYTNKDLHNESVRDIATNTEEPKVPEVIPEAPITPEEPEVPLEEVGAKIAEDAARKVLAEQEAKRQADEQEKVKEEVVDPKEKLYTEWAEKFNKDNSRPPTYLEAMEFVEERAVANIEAKQAEKEQAAKVEQDRIATQKEAENKQLDTLINDEVGELYSANKLTPIKDANNPSDQGVVEKQALMQTWMKVNTQRRAEGKPDILSATRIFDYYHNNPTSPYFVKPSAQPPGGDAPIVGNRGAAVAPSADQNYSYADLKRPWSFFRKSS